ncbi:Rieske (2Fe-2S) protein [Pseudomonas sp. Gutcm_11s]|uniref:Rieske (2Fe-2S) protein n=1 Tax=Pseudomonas sp. Gutcm_11s TaxID=3026088 RepID=UPI00236230AC|nr:Rieske (2Fe-2S) protein [Pseudomonas sp. Gutcm_11s]MDD0843612.1 Rieske (2Fe-2S) protein [Pseudomonas sp. Gutcm_11s]
MFVALERLINLQDGYRRTFLVEGRDLLLLVVEQQPLLVENRCPHQGASLHNATLNGPVLRCARHGVEFDLRSGRPLNAQCAMLNRFSLAYDGDRVGIDI